MSFNMDASVYRQRISAIDIQLDLTGHTARGPRLRRALPETEQTQDWGENGSPSLARLGAGCTARMMWFKSKWFDVRPPRDVTALIPCLIRNPPSHPCGGLAKEDGGSTVSSAAVLCTASMNVRSSCAAAQRSSRNGSSRG